MSSVRTILPSTFRSSPVLPFAPNAPGDRAHAWDWPGNSDTNPAGMTGVSVHAEVAPEVITIGYVGLSRADARTLEDFFESTTVGAANGFWCPTFQHEFYTVPDPGHGGNTFWVREWGYASTIFHLADSWPDPQIFAFRHFYGTKGAGVSIATLQSVADLGDTEPDGTKIVGYNLFDAGATVNGGAFVGTTTSVAGLAVSRCLWCRLGDDAIETTWDHPNCANMTIKAQPIPRESP